MLGPLDDEPADSTVGVQAQIGTSGIGISPSKPGIGVMKLSKACSQMFKNEYLRKD
jgi:hypothetical protein